MRRKYKGQREKFHADFEEEGWGPEPKEWKATPVELERKTQKKKRKKERGTARIGMDFLVTLGEI